MCKKLTARLELYYKYYMNEINLVIANPPYDPSKTYRKILNLFKEECPCVFVIPFSVYSYIKKNDMPECCILLNNDVFGDGCISMSNKCIVGYNVKKYRNIYVNIVEKYVKYFSDSIENHFADNKKVKLYLREHCSALHPAGGLWFKNQDIVFTFPKARCVSFDTEEDREQWKNPYNKKYWFKRLLAIINSNMRIAYNRLQYFKPGTTLEEVKQHFHFTDEEVKALEDYHV